MQRVLSFQMARGIEESNEFVTKRVCFSFIFSIGFLMLLGGFIVGRYATERAFEIREDKMKMQFIGNGLDKNYIMKNEMIQRIRESEFEASSHLMSMSKNKILESVETTLSGLNIFDKVTGNDSCVVALARGVQEADRYIALAVTDESIVVGLTIAKEFNRIAKDHNWRPQRTLIFIMSTNSMESCLFSVSNYERSKMVAYVAADKNSIKGNGSFLTAASDMVEATFLTTVIGHPSFLTNINETETRPRMAINIPHLIISFHPEKKTSKLMGNSDRNLTLWHLRIITEVMSDTLWRLSEMTIFQWNPDSLHGVIDILNDLDYPEFNQIKEKIKTSIRRIIDRGELLNERIEQIDRLKSLDVRMINDYLKDLEHALLCSDKNFQSKTDIKILIQLSKSNQSDNIKEYLYRMLKCYENVEEILNDMT